MTTITLHDLDDGVAAELRARATKHGRSVEQEACAVLREALGNADAPPEGPPEKLGTAIKEIFRDKNSIASSVTSNCQSLHGSRCASPRPSTDR